MDGLVTLRCVRESGRLRVRIISPGYYASANCRFPRAIRQEGREYLAPPASVRLCESKNGTYFYTVSQPIRIASEDRDIVPVASRLEPLQLDAGATRAAATKKRARPVEKPSKVFDVEEEPECVVCLETLKERICVPCGHYCLCVPCIARLVFPKKCPLCRTPIRTTITPSDL